jgi:hypothetical protein
MPVIAPARPLAGAEALKSAGAKQSPDYSVRIL